ncbi:hypothetical protein Aduo_018201 [Ancylostoma duodenale]
MYSLRPRRRQRAVSEVYYSDDERRSGSSSSYSSCESVDEVVERFRRRIRGVSDEVYHVMGLVIVLTAFLEFLPEANLCSERFLTLTSRQDRLLAPAVEPSEIDQQ